MIPLGMLGSVQFTVMEVEDEAVAVKLLGAEGAGASSTVLLLLKY